MTEQEKINERLKNWDRWISSETMLSVFIWINICSHFDAPWDNSDFGRCWKLVKVVPRVKEIFPKLIKMSLRRANVIDNWDKFWELYEKQVRWENDWKELYKLMKL